MGTIISEDKIPVYLEDQLKKYFSQVPNLLYEIQGLKSSHRDVYCFLTRIANRNSDSWMSHEKMASMLNMSARTLHKIKKDLCKPRPELNNEPLISITYRKKENSKQNLPSIIHINPTIWEMNFKTYLGGAKIAVGTEKSTVGGTAKFAEKEEYLKKRKYISKDIYKRKETKVPSQQVSKPKVSKPPVYEKSSATAPPLAKARYLSSSNNKFSFYGEYKKVKLTEKQYDELKEKFGEDKLKELIQAVDEWCEENGKAKKNYKLTILNWEKRQRQWDPQAKKESLTEANKKKAFDAITKLKAGAKMGSIPNPLFQDIKIHAHPTYIEFGSRSHPTSKTLKYSEHGFINQLENEFRKTGLYKYLT